ncbi:hypothetical protein D3C86_2127680 [compost metagenome]
MFQITGRFSEALALTMTLSPMTVPGLRVTPSPIWQLLPITTGPLIRAVGWMKLPSPMWTPGSRSG